METKNHFALTMRFNSMYVAMAASASPYSPPPPLFFASCTPLHAHRLSLPHAEHTAAHFMARPDRHTRNDSKLFSI